jgi:hypothetical protein
MRYQVRQRIDNSTIRHYYPYSTENNETITDKFYKKTLRNAPILVSNPTFNEDPSDTTIKQGRNIILDNRERYLNADTGSRGSFDGNIAQQ